MLLYFFIFWIFLMLIALRRYRKLLNPFTIESYFMIFFLVVPQLIMLYVVPDSKTDFYSDLVIIIYVVAVFIGTYIDLPAYAIKGIRNVKAINTLNVLLYGLLFLPILPVFLAAGSFRAFYETVVFTKFASFYELSKIVLYFLIFFKLIRKEKFSPMFFVLFPLVFFYGSRFVIVDAIIFVCVFLEQFKNVKVRTVITICVLGAIAIGVYTWMQFSAENFYYLFVSYFDIYKNQTFIINQLLEGRMDYYYGEIQFSSYLKYIPRIIWEDKPKAFGFAILNYEIFPDSAAQGYMPSFGLGSAFADFGFVSIVIVGLMAGFIRSYLYKMFLKSKNNLTFFLYVFPFSFLTNLFLIIYVLLDALISSYGKKADSSQAQPLTPNASE